VPIITKLTQVIADLRILAQTAVVTDIITMNNMIRIILLKNTTMILQIVGFARS